MSPRIPYWRRPAPREKKYVFTNPEGRKLTFVAIEAGDSVEIYLDDEEVTDQMKKLLGKEWFTEVERDLCPTLFKGSA